MPAADGQHGLNSGLLCGDVSMRFALITFRPELPAKVWETIDLDRVQD